MILLTHFYAGTVTRGHLLSFYLVAVAVDRGDRDVFLGEPGSAQVEGLKAWLLEKKGCSFPFSAEDELVKARGGTTWANPLSRLLAHESHAASPKARCIVP